MVSTIIVSSDTVQINKTVSLVAQCIEAHAPSAG